MNNLPYKFDEGYARREAKTGCDRCNGLGFLVIFPVGVSRAGIPKKRFCDKSGCVGTRLRKAKGG